MLAINFLLTVIYVGRRFLCVWQVGRKTSLRSRGWPIVSVGS